MDDLPASAQEVDTVVARLDDSDWDVRKKALQALGQLDPTSLA